MHELLHRLSAIRPLRDPVLIAGFSDHIGTTAASAISYLIEHWDAKPVAELDPDALFDFTALRPVVRLEDGKRVLQWPANRLYVASPAGGERDVVLLAGIEPHLRWRGFCEAIASFMHDVAATTSLTLGSYPGPTPHTRPVPLRLTTSDEGYGRTFGVEPTISNYVGSTGIVGVLNAHQRAQQFRNVSLSATTPFYVATDRNPHAMIALIEAIDRGFGTSTSVAKLRRHAAMLDRHAEEALRQSERLRELVRSLEQQFDGTAASPAARSETVSDLPSSGELIADLEAFLSQQRDAGSAGTNGRRSHEPGK